MRFTHQWHPDGGHSEAYDLGGHLGTVNPKVVRLVRDKLDNLSREERYLLLQEIACVAEHAYRRGYQQGTHTASEEPVDSWGITQWRFDEPLEFALFPPPCEKPTADQRQSIETAKNPWATSIYRLSCEASSSSALVHDLCAFGSPSAEELKEIWGPGAPPQNEESTGHD